MWFHISSSEYTAHLSHSVLPGKGGGGVPVGQAGAEKNADGGI